MKIHQIYPVANYFYIENYRKAYDRYSRYRDFYALFKFKTSIVYNNRHILGVLRPVPACHHQIVLTKLSNLRSLILM